MKNLIVKYEVLRTDGSHAIFYRGYKTVREASQGNIVMYHKYGRKKVSAKIVKKA